MLPLCQQSLLNNFLNNIKHIQITYTYSANVLYPTFFDYFRSIESIEQDMGDYPIRVESINLHDIV